MDLEIMAETETRLTVLGFEDSVYQFLVDLNHLKAQYLKKQIRLRPCLRISDYCVVFAKEEE